MNDRVLQLFVGRPVEQQFLALALAAAIGEKKVNEILDGLSPSGPSGDEEVAGRPVRFYSGLSKAQLRQLGLSAEEADEVYAKLGVEDAEAPVVDPSRAASAPAELAKLEEVPQEATPEAQAERVATEADETRDGEESPEPDSSGPEAGSFADAGVQTEGAEEVPLVESTSRRTKRGK